MKKVIQSMLLCVIFVSASAYIVQAQVLLPKINLENSVIVKQDGTGDFTDIKEALTSLEAKQGAEVVVFPGTYMLEERMFMGLGSAGRVLRSFAGPHHTILRQVGTFGIFPAPFFASNDRQSIVQGFTFKSGELGSWANFYNCVFDDIEFPRFDLDSGGPLELINNVFWSNRNSLILEYSASIISNPIIIELIGGLIIEGNIFYGNEHDVFFFDDGDEDEPSEDVEIIEGDGVLRIRYNNFFNNQKELFKTETTGNIRRSGKNSHL